MTTRIASTALVGAALLAVSVTQGWAGCLKPPASDQAISQFRANPQGLVAPNSDTRTIEVTTRDLAGTDASLAADIIRVAEGTSVRFQTAIAAGRPAGGPAHPASRGRLPGWTIPGFVCRGRRGSLDRRDGSCDRFRDQFGRQRDRDQSERVIPLDRDARRWRGCFRTWPAYGRRRFHHPE